MANLSKEKARQDKVAAQPAHKRSPRMLLRDWRALWGLLKDTVSKWSNDKVPRLGAALAYYTVFSLVPLLIIIIAIAGLAFGQEAAEGHLMSQMSGLVGENSAQAIQTMVANARSQSAGIMSAIVATLTLILGASGVFGQLQDALNDIWGVAPRPNRGFFGNLKHRLFSFVAVLGTGFLLLVSLVISAMLAAVGDIVPSLLPMPEIVLQVLNVIVSLAGITVLFALIFKYLPDAKIAWHDVWVGALVTALLFTAGKLAIGLYLGKSDVATTYGAAASVVVILLWVYYSSQIVLFGAEFTAVYASRYGSRIAPTKDAMAVGEPAKSGAAA